MRTLNVLLVLVAILVFSGNGYAQEASRNRVEELKNSRNKVTDQEKEALKLEILEINKLLEVKKITEEEAQNLKQEAAKKRALNIENRLAIIDNKILLLERNPNEEYLGIASDTLQWKLRLGIDKDNRPLLAVNSNKKKAEQAYDRRTYSDLVMAFGLNNSLIEGQTLEDSPYKIGGSRFFEIGWAWRTRVFENSNFMRLHYGVSFQFNGLKPTDNQYFATDGDQTVLEEFPNDLEKAKLRMDNLVFPVHLEFGPSKVTTSENAIRYAVDKQFRIGVGVYGGVNMGTRQKLKYEIDGDDIKDKIKRDYNSSNFIYGISAYTGFGGTLLYFKYDLNPLFKDAVVEQRNISLGLRFDM
ncbi:hypothetical protein [Sediminicola sp. 1XM1-17]|uniref:hypothetical protein n=1 Tax=Sediminicola sp. 1XM1-17 TaxID=3127702 RepID=UPI00307788BB